MYQAGSSEMFGAPSRLKMKHRVLPAESLRRRKVAAYWYCVNYREAYTLFISNGLLFNHESPLRGETFVTRKITRAVGRISLGLQKKLYLGNMDARRDWGFAGDYVEAMWRMLQQDTPEDFVVATGEALSVKEFVEAAFSHAASIGPISWKSMSAIFVRPKWTFSSGMLRRPTANWAGSRA